MKRLRHRVICPARQFRRFRRACALLADVFSLYTKTKNFHSHIAGKHSRDYHLLVDEQAAQIFDMTSDIAERARKIGGLTIRSIGDIAHHRRFKDND